LGAGVAGYFWYKDLTRRPAPKKDDRDSEDTGNALDSGEGARRGVRLLGAAPLLGPDVIGGQAVIEF
jgi:hypothetical protein